jgi:hypothetical protein
MAKAGIGELLDVAIALHLGDPLEPVVALHNMGPDALLPGGRINPGLWAYESKVQGPPEKFITPRGSNNHRPIAWLLDLLAGGGRWNVARVWLADWYSTMRDVAHDGSEFLSTTYGGTHSIIAMLCADLGIPGAAEHLQRQVALYALHLTSDRRLIMPGCRSVVDETPELTEWARYMLGEDHPERPRKKGGGHVKAGRELTLARRLRARRFVPGVVLVASTRARIPTDAMAPILATVKSTVGTLVHRRHERGFVSYFETGPRCYARPIAAVVCADGAEPVIVRPVTSNKGKGGNVEATGLSGDGEHLQVSQGAFTDVYDLAPLGPLVREVRIGPQGGSDG